MKKLLAIVLLFFCFNYSAFTQCDYDFYPWVEDLPGCESAMINPSPDGTGTWPYTFIWNTGFTEQILTATSFGLYSVTVTDVSGCSLEWEYDFQGNEVTSEVTNITCWNDGSIDITLISGTGPFEYSWSGPFNFASTTIDLQGLTAGDYSLTIVDGDGCAESHGPYTVEPLTQLLINGDLTHGNCTPGATGAIDLIVTGGTQPYSYAWDNGMVTEDLSGLTDGSYRVTVTDVNGCSRSRGFYIVAQNGLLVSGWSNSICDFESCVEVQVSGGTQPFTYTWPVPFNQSNNSIECGIFDFGFVEVVVTDANGCSGMVVIPIEFGGIIFNIEEEAGNDCMSTFLSANIFEGFPPFTYEWSTGESTEIILATEPGDYTLEITDAMGCNEIQSYQVNFNNTLELSENSGNTTCANSSDGFIDLMVNGGSGNYTYQWSNGETSQDIDGLSAGDYIVTVSDDTNCSQIFIVTIQSPMPFIVDIVGSSQTCVDEGTAIVTASGGTEPFSFEWSNGMTTQEINDLIAGNYFVTVTDANGCTEVGEVEIDSPIDLEVSSTYASCNNSDGTATTDVIGGAADPMISWSNGVSGSTISGLSPDWYSVTVTDNANGCQVHRNIEVEEDPNCYVKISGYAYVDDESPNCIVDPSTKLIAYAQVELSDGQMTYTDETGYYEFITDAGTYDIAISVNPNIYEVLCSGPISVTATEWGTTYPDNNFFFKYGDLKDMRIQAFKPNARRGFTQNNAIYIVNEGGVPMSGTVIFIHPVDLIYNSSIPMESNYNATDHTVYWAYENIQPGETMIFRPKLDVPLSLNLGDDLFYDFSLSPIVDDLTPANNQFTCMEVITGSFDPNDKAVTPAGTGPDGFIAITDTTLNYRIRFQNTGTDTAFTVLIRDTLDINLEVRSIVPGPSSHVYTATVKEGNILELLFENILLPDSFVNEPASNGHVFFDINLKPNRAEGTRIENTAGIYFDFNEPVITNTVVNTIEMTNAVSDLNVEVIEMGLQPNPMQGETTLVYTLNTPETVQISLLDFMGNKINVIKNNEYQGAGTYFYQVDANEFPNGVYYVRLKTESGYHESLKMIKINY